MASRSARSDEFFRTLLVPLMFRDSQDTDGVTGLPLEFEPLVFLAGGRQKCPISLLARSRS
jgi:hypothetical protein